MIISNTILTILTILEMFEHIMARRKEEKNNRGTSFSLFFV